MGETDAIVNLVRQVEEIFGRLDIVVNNAATNPVYGVILETDQRAYEKIMDVNLRGPLELCKAAHSLLQKNGGSIINISSIGGVSPEPGLGLYSISKAALISLTKVLAQEWGPDGIRVNAICPGLIKTKFSAALWQNDEIAAHHVEQTPLRRLGVPEDVVGLAVFLASEASAFCTGGVYMVDGGVTI